MHKSKFFQGYETSYYETFGRCILQATESISIAKLYFLHTYLQAAWSHCPPEEFCLSEEEITNMYMPMIWILPSIFFKIYLCLKHGLHFTYYRWQLDQSFFYCTTNITSLQYLGDHHPQPAFFTQPIVCSIFYNCQILI